MRAICAPASGGVLGAKAHVGNFVELKNAHWAKAPRPAT